MNNRNLSQALFHGSNVHLEPGAEVKSGSELHDEGHLGFSHLRDMPYDVYASKDPKHAAGFGKHVYEVKPSRPEHVHEDPDWADHPPNPSVYSPYPMHVVRRVR